jgi:hypothetical protein
MGCYRLIAARLDAGARRIELSVKAGERFGIGALYEIYASASKRFSVIRRHRIGTESTRRKVNNGRRPGTIRASYWTFGKDAPMLTDLDRTELAAERAVGFCLQTMRASRSAAITMALLMMSAPGLGQSQGRPPVATEHQDVVEKRAKEKEKIDGCQRQATEQNILPRDRPQFIIRCLDGAAGSAPPSVVAPEYQELAAKRAKEKERVDNCQKQATEQKVLPRDRPQFVISCLEK